MGASKLALVEFERFLLGPLRGVGHIALPGFLHPEHVSVISTADKHLPEERAAILVFKPVDREYLLAVHLGQTENLSYLVKAFLELALVEKHHHIGIVDDGLLYYFRAYDVLYLLRDDTHGSPELTGGLIEMCIRDRAFDIIDIIYQSTRTALNVRDTYTNISENVGKYKRMLTDFHEKCLSRGNIEPSDTLIITVNLRCIKKIGNEAEHLYRSMTDLVLYATGAAACSTSDLMTVLNSINRSLDNIRLNLNTAYFDTWRYIQVRIGYWKASVYRNKSLREIIDDAFGRWRGAGYLNYNNQ